MAKQESKIRLTPLTVSVFLIFVIAVIYAIVRMNKSQNKTPEGFMESVPTQVPSVIPSITDLEYIFQAEDRGKFALPRETRNIVPSNPITTVLDREYDWSDNVYGLLYNNNSMYIAVDDRNRIQKTPLLSNDTFGTPEFVVGRSEDITINPFYEPPRAYPAPYYCPDGFFGQGAKARTGFYVPVKSCNNRISNGSYIQYRTDDGRMGTVAGFLPNRSIDWIAIDPITQFFFIPQSNGSSLNTVSIYDWTSTRYSSRTSTSMNPRLVRNIPLIRDNRPTTIINVTAACFSSNGVFYVLCDSNNNTSGAYAFTLNRDGTKLNFMRFIHIPKQVSSFQSLDSQSLVGITCKRINSDHDDLYVLYLNKDLGTDNVSLIKVPRVW